jgi:hypothetical protein
MPQLENTFYFYIQQNGKYIPDTEFPKIFNTKSDNGAITVIPMQVTTNPVRSILPPLIFQKDHPTVEATTAGH